MTRARPTASLRPEDYGTLLAFRTELRRFLRWSEDQAKSVGLTPMQHQLLLAVKGHDGERGPSVGDVADHLLLRQHSALELVERAEAAGLLRRRRDPDDRRVVRLALTARAEADLEALTVAHREELRRLAPVLGSLAEDLH